MSFEQSNITEQFQKNEISSGENNSPVDISKIPLSPPEGTFYPNEKQLNRMRKFLDAHGLIILKERKIMKKRWRRQD